MEEGRCGFQNFNRLPSGKRLLDRPWHSWENNIRRDIKEIGANNSGHGLLESPCEYSIEPSRSISLGVK